MPDRPQIGLNQSLLRSRFRHSDMLKNTTKADTDWQFKPFQKTEDAPKPKVQVESWKHDEYFKPKLVSRFASSDILPAKQISKATQTDRRHVYLAQNKPKVNPQETEREEGIIKKQFHVAQNKTFRQKFSSIILKQLPAPRLFTVMFASVFVTLTIVTIVIFQAISVKP
ncbi:MAG: hypothetical protein ACHQT9_02175 [Candidatus Saccharimonadales bacterium]